MADRVERRRTSSGHPGPGVAGHGVVAWVSVETLCGAVDGMSLGVWLAGETKRPFDGPHER